MMTYGNESKKTVALTTFEGYKVIYLHYVCKKGCTKTLYQSC